MAYTGSALLWQTKDDDDDDDDDYYYYYYYYYVGVHIDCKLHLHYHVNFLFSHALKLLGVNSHNNTFLFHLSLLMLYFALVRSKLKYSSAA
jgi:hypothetical protein